MEKVKCGKCNGTGKCPRCHGTGVITDTHFNIEKGPERIEQVCDFCRGTGKCPYCN